jgi:hypothetical protein
VEAVIVLPVAPAQEHADEYRASIFAPLEVQALTASKISVSCNSGGVLLTIEFEVRRSEVKHKLSNYLLTVSGYGGRTLALLEF